MSLDVQRNAAGADKEQVMHGSASHRYLLVAKIVSVIWLGSLAVYFVVSPSLFLRMWPYELGELLSGWFAPLAMAWLSVAVFLQWAQVRAQETEIKQNSEALQAQTAELRRSVELMEKQTENMLRESDRRDREQSDAWLDRLYERLTFGAERIARTSEGCRLNDPAMQNEATQLVDIIGDWRAFAEHSRGHEVARSLDALGSGLRTVVDLIKQGWVLDVSLTQHGELCRELRNIERIIVEVERVRSRGLYEQSSAWLLGDFDSKALREQVATTYSELEALQANLLALDDDSRMRSGRMGSHEV